MDILSTCTKLKADLDSIDKNEDEHKNMMSVEPAKYKIKWLFSLYFISVHLLAIYGLYLVISAKIYTTIFGFSLIIVSGLGISAGVHRLWSHKSYKAKWPLQFILMIMYTLTFKFSIYDWCMDHRIHHKYTDTNSDPHNSSRGFFFSHMGWLLIERHPDFNDKCKKIYMEDLKKNRIVMFQKIFIKPVDNSLVATFTFGEGLHNYHHVFPWDYKTPELFNYKHNLTTTFIDFFAIIGWAYDMKTASKDMILKRANRTGDGTYIHRNSIWGWDDSNVCSKDRILTTILNKKDN